MISLAKIREIRRTRKLTLDQLAERTGFSRSYLSQVERSVVNPSISALDKILEALDITISEIIGDNNREDAEPNFVVVNPEERHKLIYPGSNVANEMLTPTLNNDFEFFWTHIPPGEGSRDSPYSHTGYECGLVIQGTMEFHIGEDVITLNPGQSICFDPNVPHYWRNIGDCDVHAVWVISPSSFSTARR
jgi:transcriptional regulator with XRE-family HTH domain